jgi:hypothetical protein
VIALPLLRLEPIGMLSAVTSANEGTAVGTVRLNAIARAAREFLNMFVLTTRVL